MIGIASSLPFLFALSIIYSILESSPTYVPSFTRRSPRQTISVSVTSATGENGEYLICTRIMQLSSSYPSFSMISAPTSQCLSSTLAISCKSPAASISSRSRSYPFSLSADAITNAVRATSRQWFLTCSGVPYFSRSSSHSSLVGCLINCLLAARQCLSTVTARMRPLYHIPQLIQIP